MSWHIAPGAFRGIAGLDHAALGIPDEASTSASTRSARARTDRELELLPRVQPVPDRRDPAGRVQARDRGIASSDNAVKSGENAKALAELGWRYAQRA